MQPAQTFGRRGLGAPAPTAPVRQPPAAKAPVSAKLAPWSAPTQTPARPRSDTGSVVHLLFGFEGRMRRSTYVLMRIVTYVVLLALILAFAGMVRQNVQDPAALIGVVLAGV